MAAVVRYTGTGKATGKQLNLPVVHVFDVRMARSRGSDSSQTPQSSWRSCRASLNGSIRDYAGGETSRSQAATPTFWTTTATLLLGIATVAH